LFFHPLKIKEKRKKYTFQTLCVSKNGTFIRYEENGRVESTFFTPYSCGEPSVPTHILDKDTPIRVIFSKEISANEIGVVLTVLKTAKIVLLEGDF